METLSIRSFPSHFTQEVEDLHSHFSGRCVNQQLLYYQGLMDQRKRGVAISTLVDGQEKSQTSPGRSPRNSPVPSGLRSPTASFPYARQQTQPGSSPNTVVSPASGTSSDFEMQKSLPSFSNLDRDPDRASKVCTFPTRSPPRHRRTKSCWYLKSI